MKRGEVWWIQFDPSIGGEIKKKRPAVIISNDLSNKFLNRVQVIPLSSKTGRIYPSESSITVKGKKGKAMADQIMTVSKLRLIQKYGFVEKSDMARIDVAIKAQLGLT